MSDELREAALAANESLRLMLINIYTFEGGSDFTCKWCGVVSVLDAGKSSFVAKHNSVCTAGTAIANLNRLNEVLSRGA